MSSERLSGGVCRRGHVGGAAAFEEYERRRRAQAERTAESQPAAQAEPKPGAGSEAPPAARAATREREPAG